MSKIQKVSQYEFLQLLKQDLIHNEYPYRDNYDDDAKYETVVRLFNCIDTIDGLIWQLCEEGWDAPSVMRLLVAPFVEVGDDMRDLPSHYDT